MPLVQLLCFLDGMSGSLINVTCCLELLLIMHIQQELLARSQMHMLTYTRLQGYAGPVATKT